MEKLSGLSSISASWRYDMFWKYNEKKHFGGINYEKCLKLSDTYFSVCELNKLSSKRNITLASSNSLVL